jgi:transposase
VHTHPDPIATRVLRHAGENAKLGVETGSMTPWLVHGLRGTGLDVECLDARPVKAALQMRLNKTDENDAEGLAQVMRTGGYRPVSPQPSARSVTTSLLRLRHGTALRLRRQHRADSGHSAGDDRTADLDPKCVIDPNNALDRAYHMVQRSGCRTIPDSLVRLRQRA